MIENEFSLEFALLARGAILLQMVQPDANPVTVRLYSKDHQTVFWAMIDHAYMQEVTGHQFWVSILAGVDSAVPLQERFISLDDNLLRELALTVENAMEELVARKHRGELVDLLAKKAPDPAELRAFCDKAGIPAAADGLTVEECAVLSAWLEAPEMRRKASTAAPSDGTPGLDSYFF
jgi:hypothetical protein